MHSGHRVSRSSPPSLVLWLSALAPSAVIASPAFLLVRRSQLSSAVRVTALGLPAGVGQSVIYLPARTARPFIVGGRCRDHKSPTRIFGERNANRESAGGIGR